MPSPAASKQPVVRTNLSQQLKRSARAVGMTLLRGYALVLIALIVFLSFNAIRYLVASLIIPSKTPQQIAGLPRRMDESLIRGSRPDWLGLESVTNPRAPLDHFHRFDTWIEPDRFNDCTRSGCHSPLPHSVRKETRAFLNMHATSMHCAVCHFDEKTVPLALTWYDIETGKPSAPPALLRAYGWLTARTQQSTFTRDEQSEIAGLVREAARAAHDDAALLRIAQQLEGFRPSGENFVAALQDATDLIRRMFRGSYGAKLALRDMSGEPIFSHPNTQNAVRDWLANGANAAGSLREKMLTDVHPRRRAETRHCSECHVEKGGLVEFEKLGYPPARVYSLHNSPVFQMIQHIREGRPFYLPGFGVPTGGEEKNADK